LEEVWLAGNQHREVDLMAGLISSAEAIGIRDALSVFLTHTYTRTPMLAGAADSENSVTYTTGTPVTAVPCKYRASDRVQVEISGALVLRAPTLSVAHDDPLKAGDQISNIKDSEGVVLLAGPVTAGPAVHSAGLGPTLKKKFVLRGAEVTI
jgi:hypothetical protein